MLYYLQHTKKPRKMSPRDFSLQWRDMLRHTLLLETHYEEIPSKVKQKLMYMRAYPKVYHHKFMKDGKKFDEMNKEAITQYFQILHKEEEETKSRGPPKAEGSARGNGGCTASKTSRGSHKNKYDNLSNTRRERSSEHKSGPNIVNQCTLCSVPREYHECRLHNRKYWTR